MKENQAEIEQAIENEFQKSDEFKPGKRSILTAAFFTVVEPQLQKLAFDIALKLIQKKFPAFQPSANDAQFVNSLASKIIGKLLQKGPQNASPTGLSDPVRNTPLLVGLLGALKQKTGAKDAESFIKEAKAEVKSFLGFDLSAADEREIADKARAVFGGEGGTTATPSASDDILKDEATRNKVEARLRAIDAVNTEAKVLETGKNLTPDDRITNLKATINATVNNSFNDFLREVTQGKKTKFADLSASDQALINDQIIPEIVKGPAASSKPEVGADEPTPPTQPKTRRRPPSSSSSGTLSSGGRINSSTLVPAVVVPRCRLFRGSTGRAVILRGSGASSLGSRYVIIER